MARRYSRSLKTNTYRTVRSLLMASAGCLLLAATGCTPPPEIAPSTPSVRSPQSQDSQTDSGTKYTHAESGVTFIYPKDWQVGEPESMGPMTGLPLQKGTSTVTLSWSPREGLSGLYTLGEQEAEKLRPMYGDALGKPQSLQIGKVVVFKIPISSGPLGMDKNQSMGAVYVFGVQHNGQDWKIKLRATVDDPAKLGDVEKLLENYRF